METGGYRPDPREKPSDKQAEEHAKEIEAWERKLETNSDSEIQSIIATSSPRKPKHIAGKSVLENRAKSRDPVPPLVTSLTNEVRSMAREVTKPFWRKHGFWIGVISIILAGGFGLVELMRKQSERDLSTAPIPAVSNHVQSAMPLTESRTRLSTVLTQQQKLAATSTVQRATGSIFTNQERKPPPKQP